MLCLVSGWNSFVILVIGSVCVLVILKWVGIRVCVSSVCNCVLCCGCMLSWIVGVGVIGIGVGRVCRGLFIYGWDCCVWVLVMSVVLSSR